MTHESLPDTCLFESPVSEVAPQSRASRPRDPIFDAIAEACGIDPRCVFAKSIASRLGKVKRDIIDQAEAAGLPTEPVRLAAGIMTRAQRYRERWPRMTLSPEALAKHFSELGPVSTHLPPVALSGDELRRMSLYA